MSASEWTKTRDGKWVRFDYDRDPPQAVGVVKETACLRGRYIVLRPPGDYRDYSRDEAMAVADQMLEEQNNGKQQRAMG